MYRIAVILAFGLSIAWFVSNPDYEPAIAVLLSTAAFIGTEIHGIIGFNVLSLRSGRALIRSFSSTRFAFTRDEYVNPLILADLTGWLSDIGDQVVAVDVVGSNKSNKYLADEIDVTDAEPNCIVTASRDETSFSYQYLGCSVSGIHLVRTWDRGGGSGVFCGILLITVAEEPALTIEPDSTERKERFVVRKHSDIRLGDRYTGEISYRFGLLTIGPCLDTATIRESRQRLFIL